MAEPDADLGDRAREAILELLTDRGPDKTICPSEAARALACGDDFPPYIEPVREAAAQLANRGRIEVTQKGKRVTIGGARGPIRLRLRDPDRRRRTSGSRTPGDLVK